MNIERVFSVKGFGTVVSGIPLSGKIKTGDELELLPSDKKTAVKSIQNYKHNTDTTYASLCSAINLRDIPAEEISRGMTIATPGYFRPAKSATVELLNISKDTPIKHNSLFKFHSGTCEVNAKACFIWENILKPGGKSVSILKFDEPVTIAAGDRFVLRRLSPSGTIGGGVVISSSPVSEKRTSETLRNRIAAAFEAASKNKFFESELYANPDFIIEHQEAVRLTGLLRPAAEKLILDKISEGFIADLKGGSYLVFPRIQELAATISKELAAFHKNQQQISGMDAETFCRIFNVKPANFARLIEILISAQNSEIKIANGKIALKTFVPAASSKLMQLKDKLLELVEKSGINCVAYGTILETGAITEQELKSVIKMLVDEKSAVVIGNHLISGKTFEDCRKQIVDIIAQKGVLEIGDFKNATGASRNMSVALLEKFDGLGFTKRLPKGRVLLKRG
jgi:selenocysteine-specific elongation factor